MSYSRKPFNTPAHVHSTPPLPTQLQANFGADAPSSIRSSRRQFACLLALQSGKFDYSCGSLRRGSPLRIRFSVNTFLPTAELSWGVLIGEGLDSWFRPTEMLVLDPDMAESVELSRYSLADLQRPELAQINKHVQALGSDGLNEKDTGIIVFKYIARTMTASPRFRCTAQTLPENILCAAAAPGMSLTVIATVSVVEAPVKKKAGDVKLLDWYRDLLVWRYLTPDGKPRNDWHGAHHRHYLLNTEYGRYNDVLRNGCQLRIPPWLAPSPNTVAGQMIEHNRIGPPPCWTDPTIPAAVCFKIPSGHAYENIFAPATIWEARCEREEHADILAPTLQADFTWFPATARFGITFAFPLDKYGGSMPRLLTDNTLLALTTTDNVGKDRVFVGKIRRIRGSSVNAVTVHAPTPNQLRPADVSGRRPVTVRVHGLESEQQKHIDAIAAVARWLDEPRAITYGFDIRNALLGQLPVSRGFNFLAGWMMAWLKDVWTDNLRTVMDRILGGALLKLNDAQQNICHLMWTGPPGGLLACLGNSGTGKTFTIAVGILPYILMNQQVAVVAQTDAAVDTLLLYIRQLLDAIGRSDLIDMTLRLGDLPYERDLDARMRRCPPDCTPEERRRWLRNPTFPVGDPDSPANAKLHDSHMVPRVLRWAREHEAHEDALALCAWRDCGEFGGVKPARPESYHAAFSAAMRHTISTMRIFACTLSSADALRDRFPARTLVVDDIGQTRETEVLLALTALQQSVKLVVIAGDLSKGRPSAVSERFGENPLRDVIRTSPLQRWLVMPIITRIVLTKKYSTVVEQNSRH